MRDEEGLRRRKTASNGSSDGGYSYMKLWALAAMSLLAIWSMLSGSVTLKWTTDANLKHVSDHLDSGFHHHLDILELEEREKKVKHMWNAYIRHSNTMRLPSFWREAFEAAYEDLVSEVPATQNAAISEIAKMSFHADVQFQSPKTIDNKSGKLRKKGKQQKQ